MYCLICRELEQKLEDQRVEFAELRCSASFGVSTKRAASKNVDMEQVRSELQDHRSVCAFASAVPVALDPRETRAGRGTVAA